MSDNIPATSVASLINQNFKAMKSVLPRHMTAERMARIALLEVRRNPKLGQADPATLVGAILVASQLGLEPGIQGAGYLIPYWNKNNQCYEVQFQAGYRGLLDLARRSGGVGLISAEAVREQDHFQYRLGSDPMVEHIPAQGDRGEITHVYAIGKLVPSNHVQFRVMEIAEIEKVRDVHSRANEGGFSPWKTHFEEMALKTVLRRLAKLLPSSPILQKAISLDELAGAGISQDLAAELPIGLEIEADDLTNNIAQAKTTETIEDLKRDINQVDDHGFKPAESESDAPAEPIQMVPEPDDFSLMDAEQLNGFLEVKKPGFQKGGDFADPLMVKMINSGIKATGLDVKRELCRRAVAYEPES